MQEEHATRAPAGQGGNERRRASCIARPANCIHRKFGREPGPTDPVFFDPDKDLPTQISDAKIQEHLTAALRKAGLDESRIKALLEAIS